MPSNEWRSAYQKSDMQNAIHYAQYVKVQDAKQQNSSAL
jgi:hypothetical protein